MANPTVGGWKALKRLARYLKGKPRVIIQYPWQGREREVEVFSDSDWAGCKTTGKSTSGGVIMIGEHFLKGWARTQNSVTLSSAEADLVAMGKAAAELIGVGAMSKDFGDDTDGVLHADSSAAIAIAKRRGSGKLRHINIASLWIQERIEQKELTVKKVSGLANPAHMMTKHLGRQN